MFSIDLSILHEFGMVLTGAEAPSSNTAMHTAELPQNGPNSLQIDAKWFTEYRIKCSQLDIVCIRPSMDSQHHLLIRALESGWHLTRLGRGV